MINLSSILAETFSQIDFNKEFIGTFIIITPVLITLKYCVSGLKFAFEIIKNC